MIFKGTFQPKPFYESMIFSGSEHPQVPLLLTHALLFKSPFATSSPQLQTLVEL